MKIEKYFDKQAGKEMWRFDVTINGRRRRRGKLLSRRDAELAVAALRVKAQSETYGLPSPVKPVSVKEFLGRLKSLPCAKIQRLP